MLTAHRGCANESNKPGAYCNRIFQETDYYTDPVSKLRESNTPEAFEFLLANELSASINMGYFEGLAPFIEELGRNDTASRYKKRLVVFNELINNALSNVEYGLGREERMLDSTSFEALIKNQDGLPIYIAFWCARYSEAFITPFLPHHLHMEEEFQGKVKVIDICVDKPENKALWAAKIIDNKWTGDHYFLPVESERLTSNKWLLKYVSRNIFSLCDGECYSLFDKYGKLINNNVPSPREFSDSVLNEFLGKAD